MWGGNLITKITNRSKRLRGAFCVGCCIDVGWRRVCAARNPVVGRERVAKFISSGGNAVSITDRPLKKRLGNFDDLISRALNRFILKLADRLKHYVDFDVLAVAVNVTPPRSR